MTVMHPDQALDLAARSLESIAGSLEKLSTPLVSVRVQGEPPDHDWNDHGICTSCSYARYSCPGFPVDNAPTALDADDEGRTIGELEAKIADLEGRLEASEIFQASPCPLLTETIARIAEVSQLTLAGEGMRKAYVWIGDIAQAARRGDAAVVHRLIADSKRRGA